MKPLSAAGLVLAAALTLANPVLAAPRLSAPATPGIAEKSQCVLDHLPPGDLAKAREAAKTDLLRALELGRFTPEALGGAYDACPMDPNDSQPVASYTVGLMVQSFAEIWMQENRAIDAAALDAAWTAMPTSDRRKLANAARDHKDLADRLILGFCEKLGVADKIAGDKDLYAAARAYVIGRSLREAYGDA